MFRAEKFRARCLRPYKLTGHIDKDSRYIVHKGLSST
jgi:hypothetical protein